MEQIGIVVNVENDYMDILSTRESACGSDCSTCQAKCSESKPFKLHVLNTIDAKPGDRVKIEMNSKAVLGYMTLVYGLPCLFFIVGVLVAFIVLENSIKNNVELYSFISGLVLMAISYIIIKSIDKKYKNLAKNNMIIRKI